MTLSVVPCLVRDEWDAAVNSQQGHPMQLWGWGETKAAHNWSVDHVLVKDGQMLVGSAQILLRSLPVPFRSLAYLARGPQAEPGREHEVLDAVGRYVKATHKSVALSIEPDWDADTVAVATLPATGWSPSPTSILIPRTLILDLTRTEEQLLAAMSKKTRQYIRKSSREALVYRAVTAAELPLCMAVYKETAQRAEFGIHEDAYYSDILANLAQGSPIYGAFDGEKLVAFLWLAASESTAFELYGGMSEEGSVLRANFSLKWLAIQEMKARGIRRYDFNGLLNDGVSKFKFGFADHENMLAGTWDLGLSPLYPVFAKALPVARRSLKKVRGLLKR
ncbi:lipid II:glycine glycyltransferase FemX [Arthrobacter psychrochitiniphilus]|uniref:Methicillin resistance protein n=1 Tax=Arthrobacter psychrochitiniphilus TaxID=291045 RepID=A0A2V3E2B4_9MICC|nr:peptidoglycan bridge formation glycyltransferase FemA/FemB family protein [Arthrobacter psychrochitiniphilus]NYG16503.1 lipid II:glycine glycyltransferase (peptidoglycan interpeptide bridge formation enzyme) [Arthrobacter psychrochitiniphilus]PXA69364.1 methicillin resistance protein [Arthrobacter psychrochitiniphilus]